MNRHPSYEIFEELGRGEHTVVSRGYDLNLGREVAVKRLAELSAGDPRRVEQFLKEASFLAQYEHENVLRVYSVEKEHGWIVMELMKGTLQGQIARRPFDPDTVRSVMRQILGALDFLHRKGKVHGAVRPTNILINEHGTVKLSDFEPSSLKGELRAPTGSKKYLAPELIRPQLGSFGPTVDLYCLGFTALELLTGPEFDSLFPGTGKDAIDADVAWLRWHSSEESLPPIKTYVPQTPDDLASVIDRLVAKNAGERPQTASDVLAVLADQPLVPVEVPEPSMAPDEAHASAPPTLLREIAPPQSPDGKSETKAKPRAIVSPRTSKKGKGSAASASASATPQSSSDRINKVLGKPYVLYPLCVSIMIGALLVGLQLNRDRADAGGTLEKTDPVVQVRLNITPDEHGATVLIDGTARSAGDEGDYALKPGQYELAVTKDGFLPFTESLAVTHDNRVFNIELQPTPSPKKVGGQEDRADEIDGGDPPPSVVDVQIEVSPPDAELLLSGHTEPLVDGALQYPHADGKPLDLAVRKEGFQSVERIVSWDQLQQVGFLLRIDLQPVTKTVPPEVTQLADLPPSLVPKEGSPIDSDTGLPQRVFLKKLQGRAPLELALVRAGDYNFGVTDGDVRTWELAGARIQIERPFYMAIQETSASQYEVFYDQAGAHLAGDAWRDLVDTWSSSEEQLAPTAQLPVSQLSVLQAARFCQWAGGRLPTEEEWEASVRGLDDAGYPLPWDEEGVSADRSRARLFHGGDARPLPVDRLDEGASSLGLLNTIGNISEWCNVPCSPNEFVVKGCSYTTPPGDHVRVTWRGPMVWQGAPDVGFRLMVPAFDEGGHENPALAFAPNLELPETETPETEKPDEVGEITPEDSRLARVDHVKLRSDEFVGEAELVIDSGGFISEIYDVAFSPDGTWLAACGEKVVRIWDIRSGDLVATLRGDRSRTSYGNCYSVEFSPDGKNLLVGVNDYRAHGSIRLYETNNLTEIKALLPGHTAPCRKLAFSRDGKYMASADADGNLLIWDWPQRSIVKRIPPRDPEQPIYDLLTFPTAEPFLLAVDFEGPQLHSVPDGARLGPNDSFPNSIRAWLMDIFGDQIQYPYDAKEHPRVLDFRLEQSVWAAAGVGKESGRNRFWVGLWPSRELEQGPAARSGGYRGHRWSITCIDLGHNSDVVASGDKFGEVHVWNRTSGQQLHRFAGQGKSIYEVAFDRKTSRIAFGTQPNSPQDWKRNDYGTATKVLDLRQRAVIDAQLLDDLQLVSEQPKRDDISVDVRRERESASYYLQKRRGGKIVSQYRISSGRNPTVFTLLDEPKLDVQQPIVFGDNEGLLALWNSASDELKRAFLGHESLVTAVSPSPNGRMIASSSTDRTIRLWSLEDHQPTGIFDFKFENTSVIDVRPGTSSAEAGVQAGDRILSIDGKSLTDMYNLMLERKFDYRPGQVVPVGIQRNDRTFQYDMTLVDGYDFADPILNIYLGDRDQWIIWSPLGYYDAAPGADRLIGWHVNRGPDKSARFFRVQQFREQLYRPDIIDRILETGSVDEAIALANQQRPRDTEVHDFRDTQQIAQNHPPLVRIERPIAGQRLGEERVTLTAQVQSVNGLPIMAVTLLVNGTVAKVFKPTELNQQELAIEHGVMLLPGKNELALIAANARSSSDSERVLVEVPTTAPQRGRSNAYLLAIGIASYKNVDRGFDARPFAANDAEQFVNIARAHQDGQLYDRVQTRLLTNENATRTNILDGLQWLVDTASDDDVVMIFVAGHGFVDSRENYYLSTYDVDATRPRSSAISWREFTVALHEDLPACQRIVFLDTPTVGELKPGSRNPLLDLAAPELGTVFFSSTTLQQPTIEMTGRDQGVFAEAILTTLRDRSADMMPTPRDALLNPVELATSLTSQMKRITADKQHPVAFSPEEIRLRNVLELQN